MLKVNSMDAALEMAKGNIVTSTAAQTIQKAVIQSVPPLDGTITEVLGVIWENPRSRIVMRVEPVVLEGKHVRLEPINESHIGGLCQAISDGELWKLFVTIVPHPDDIEQFLNDAIKAQEMGDGLTFATIEKSTNKIAGSTRFMKADLRYKRVEIGFTFLGQTWQRSRINSEAKFLMFSHAFDTLGLNRVELITDYLNTNSRRAVLRLGAKEEGILRNHMVMPDGRVRDSVLYSIIKNEWPGIKQHLMHRLQ